MIPKAATDIIILLCLATLWVSTSRATMSRMYYSRNVNAWWGMYPLNHGDMMSWSYLDLVKRFCVKPARKTIDRAPQTAGAKKTVLYLFGDSYSYELADSAFTGLAGYYPMNRYFENYIHCDTTYKNILIIEMSERFARQYLCGYQVFDNLKDTIATNNHAAIQPNNATTDHYSSFLPNIALDSFFNPHINQNLQFNLFNYQFISPLFETKAILNYYLFYRTSNNSITISDNGNYLFYSPTVDPDVNTSSYSKVDASEINNMIDHANNIYDHYKKIGFAEVYLSIIPNTATIVQPAGYNNLLPDLQQNEKLRIKTIDMYTRFRNTKEEVYLRADTHWSMIGKQMWVDEINKITAGYNL